MGVAERVAEFVGQNVGMSGSVVGTTAWPANALVVDPVNGSDGNLYFDVANGTAAWATLGRAAWGQELRPTLAQFQNPGSFANASEAAQPGDTVIVLPGTQVIDHSNQNDSDDRTIPLLMSMNSGTPGNPIVYKAQFQACTTSTINRTILEHNYVNTSHPGTNLDGGPILGGIGAQSYVTFDGFYIDENQAHTHISTGVTRFSGAPGATGMVIRNCRISGLTQDITGDNHALINAEGVDNMLISNNRLENCRYPGDSSENGACIMFYSARNCIVEHNFFANNTTNLYIKSNTLAWGSSGIIFRFNYLWTTFHHAIVLQYVDGIDVYQNILNDCRKACVKIQHSAPEYATSVQVVNNVLYNCLYATDGAIRFSNNAIPSVLPVFMNNIIMGSAFAAVGYSVSGANPPAQSFFNNNWYFNNTATPFQVFAAGMSFTSWRINYPALDINSSDAIDPQFTNPGADFTLQGSSGCLDFGVDVLDLLGNGVSAPVNAGCYVSPGQTEDIGLVPEGVAPDYLYENDMVDETAAGVRMVTYTTPAQTASMHPNWWGTDPAIEYLLLPQSTEYNTGSYIQAPNYWPLSTSPTIHFRMLVEFGPGYWEAHASHSDLGKFIWVGNAGDGGNPQCWLKGVIDNENILGNGADYIYYTALAVGSNGGFPVAGEFGEEYQQDWYDTHPGEIHSFRANEYEGQQICFEVEATLGGLVHVYISTRDGVFTDAAPYASCAADAGVGNLPWDVMQPFVIMRDCANAISTSWVRFGQFVISESKIGPPADFVSQVPMAEYYASLPYVNDMSGETATYGDYTGEQQGVGLGIRSVWPITGGVTSDIGIVSYEANAGYVNQYFSQTGALKFRHTLAADSGLPEDDFGCNTGGPAGANDINIGPQINAGMVFMFTRQELEEYDHTLGIGPGYKLCYLNATDGVHGNRITSFTKDLNTHARDAAYDTNGKIWIPRLAFTPGGALETGEGGIAGNQTNYNAGLFTFLFNYYMDEYIYMEFEAQNFNNGNRARLYVYTQDGVHQGGAAGDTPGVPLIEIIGDGTSGDQNVSNTGNWKGAEMLTYIKGCLADTVESYTLIDSIRINNSFMGPPLGF